MRVLAAAGVAALALVTPARAVPPMSLTGRGYIAPGLDGLPRLEAFRFVGVGTPLLSGPGVSCQFDGTGYGATGHVAGTMSGACGTQAYSGCAFDATPAAFTIACPNAAGTLAVSGFNGITFDASGVLA